MMLETTQMIGHRHFRFSELDSTNRRALELLKSKPPEGTAVSAEAQTAGRGQASNTWESEPGKNILVSVILYPTFLHPREQFYLNQVISLAVRDAVEDLTGTKTYIKWPNDIYVGDRKICGLLIQNSITSQKIQSSVVGIGININQEQFSEVIPNPTSVKKETELEVDLEKAFETLFTKIAQYYLQLRTRNFELIRKAYHNYLYRFGKEAHFRDIINQSVFSGKISGTTPHGRLKISVEERELIFDLKEIKFL